MPNLVVRLAMLGVASSALLPLAAADLPPRLRETPVDAVTNVGGAASFRVVVDDDSAVGYQWLHDDLPVPAATAAIFVIPHATSADAGRYEVRVRTASGTFSGGSAALTVRPPPAQPIVDPTFHGDPAIVGTPTVILPQPDGRVWLATTSVKTSWDFMAKANLYRLLPDGRIDPAFAVATAGGEEFPRNVGGARTPPEPPFIRQLLAQPDGRMIAVGNFRFLNGVACGGIARLNPDGTVDETFRPSLTVHHVPSISPYSSTTVAALLPDGKILVLASSFNQTTAVVRLERDGHVDPTFVASDISAGAQALAVDRRGRILFGKGGGPRGPAGSAQIMALQSEGGIDPTFVPFVCDPVQRLFVLENGNIVVTTQFDGGPVFPGMPGPRFPATTFRLRPDGSKDPAFATRPVVLLTSPAADGTLFLNGKLIGPDGTTETTPQLGVPSQPEGVNSFTPGTDGRLWVTGTFSFYNGVSSSRIARLNAAASENLTPPRTLAIWADKPVVKVNEPVTLHVAPVGEGPLTYTWLWPFNTGILAVTNEPELTLAGSTAAERIPYTVRIENSAGAVTSQAVTVINEPGDLRIDWQPRHVSLTSGRRAALSVRLSPGAQPNFSEWRRDGIVLRPDANGTAGPIQQVGESGIVFGTAQPAHAGTYSVTFRDKLNRSVSTEPIVVTVDDQARFANLSTRAHIGAGQQAAILGFVIPPGQNRTILLRGIGPGLDSFGVPGALADPRLDLFDSTGEVLQRNNGWQASFIGDGDFERAGAFPLATSSRDTALQAELPPGSYTVRLASLSGAAGVGLIELYENDPVSDRLTNLSSRVAVSGGPNGAAIAGFAIRGMVNKKVLLRVAGPALAAFGVSDPLDDPRLEIRDQQGTLVAANDDWPTQPEAAAVALAATQVGAFPFRSESKDAALVRTLPPGNYSAIVVAKTGRAGTALIEVYEVP